tara:strand:+ start:1319 stop:1915 length:597 start_codon:yes stop_codon:yes gene_type:complete
MKQVAIVYHSANGHTEHIASQVLKGLTSAAGIEARLLQASDLAVNPKELVGYDGIILGSPTYLGGVSAPLKAFMDATGQLWRTQSLVGRLAAGFTVSGLPSDDKQSTLMSMFVFCMQHGMLWTGNPILPQQHMGVPYDEAANRLGSWSGLMAQADKTSAPDAFAPGDIKTAKLFGRHFAETLMRLGAAATVSTNLEAV